jgi:hypothetical protein
MKFILWHWIKSVLLREHAPAESVVYYIDTKSDSYRMRVGASGNHEQKYNVAYRSVAK